jgi:hypothetical protein
MAHMISIPDDLFVQLEKIAKPFKDKEPADVIRRLLETVESTEAQGGSRGTAPVRPMSRSHIRANRNPRERGVRVRVDGEDLAADSVRDLFEQVLRRVSRNGKLESVRAILPYKTSSSRYLIAERPVHPGGNAFVVPVGQRGLFMEAHKSYGTALTQLSNFLAKLGMSLEYVS